MRRAFTMLELIIAVVLVGVVTSMAMGTFYAVSHGWEISTEYIDKAQRTDYAIDQVMSGLRSMYYPHDGQQDSNCGFILKNNGDGESPDESDVIEWSKTGPAIVGTKNAVADTVHRVQLMVLEEGDSDYRDSEGRKIPITVTGLYARQCPDIALRPKENEDEVDFSFANDEMYAPVLVADGIVGFNCRVLKNSDDADGGIRNGSENDKRKFEDEYAESNAVPYKVELTFYVKDPEAKSYRTDTKPMMRIIRIPIHEQSQDGAKPPSDEETTKKKATGK